MIVVMKIGHRPEQRDAVVARIRELGLREREIVGVERTVLAVLGQVYPELRDELVRMDGVDDVVRISKPYKLASRETHPEDTVVDLPYGLRVGGGETVVIAGPCSIESEEQLFESARAVRRSGAHILRGGAFKPRSSPYSFRGLGR
ncbi:MAG: 3-deoxy-7-phosphoheptulonate synthase, partial [Chloroflexi bacterium]|nr:3-deoxy-7-phosphoheptulonate synthase [Chloroflexota bacterium]